MPKICEINELWVPGMHLDNDYPIASNEELERAWASYTGYETVASTTNVYGVYGSLGKIAGIASIDLCEVVRESSYSIDHTHGLPPARRSNYEDGTWVEHVDKELETGTIMPIVQAAMNAGLIEPNEAIGDIAIIMQRWRNAGVYIAANTSTLPGCELATINLFMKRWLPNCFDALILPRNHDGTGSISKADALAYLADDLNVNIHELPLVKIDDATHHIESFLSRYGEHTQAAYFIPKHTSNTEKLVKLHADSSLEAFQKADSFFREQGVAV